MKFGPLLDPRYAQSLLGAPTHEGLHELIRQNRLLAVTSHGGQTLIPLFQFTGDGRLHPALGPVLDALAEAHVTGWKVATWLFKPNAELAEADPITWLRQGRDVDAVLAAARHAPAPA